MDDPLQPRNCFGGAIDLSLPSRFIDVSDFRPIPDNQEVFTDADLDQSLIIEIVEHHDIPDAEAGQFFFEDLVQSNSAIHQSIISLVSPLPPKCTPNLPSTAHCILVTGQFSASKGRQGVDAINKVHICLLIVRIHSKKSDVLITFNTPIYISEHSAVAQHTGAGYKEASLFAPELFSNIIKTLNIKDWELFGS